MKTMFRAVLTLGLLLTATTSAQAVITTGPEVDATEVYVVNNHISDVRVYAEDADGKLHRLGRVARGHLKNFAVPAEVATGEFRIKVFPAGPVWDPSPNDYGIKTQPLKAGRDRFVTVWLETELSSSLVQVAAG